MKKYSTKIKSFNLQEMLVVLVIIGILILIAIPSMMPLISRAKATEAQMQLKHIYNTQRTHFFMYSKYAANFNEIGFEVPLTTENGGNSNYNYEIVSATNNAFKAKATAITDFDGDGVFNVWEIDQNQQLKELIKD